MSKKIVMEKKLRNKKCTSFYWSKDLTKDRESHIQRPLQRMQHFQHSLQSLMDLQISSISLTLFVRSGWSWTRNLTNQKVFFQKSNIDTKNGHILTESTFSKPSFWVSMLVFGDVSQNFRITQFLEVSTFFDFGNRRKSWSLWIFRTHKTRLELILCSWPKRSGSANWDTHPHKKR